jgi:hypothetical protein
MALNKNNNNKICYQYLVSMFQQLVKSFLPMSKDDEIITSEDKILEYKRRMINETIAKPKIDTTKPSF